VNDFTCYSRIESIHFYVIYIFMNVRTFFFPESVISASDCRNVQGQKRYEKIFTGGPVLAHTTQSDRCASGALTGLCRYATYCTNEVAPMRDAKVVAPTNSTQHRRSRLIVAKFNISYIQMSFKRNSIFTQLMFLVITPARRTITYFRI